MAHITSTESETAPIERLCNWLATTPDMDDAGKKARIHAIVSQWTDRNDDHLRIFCFTYLLRLKAFSLAKMMIDSLDGPLSVTIQKIAFSRMLARESQ